MRTVFHLLYYLRYNRKNVNFLFDTGTFVKMMYLHKYITEIILPRLYMTSTDIFEAKNTSFYCLSCNFDMVPVSDKCQIRFHFFDIYYCALFM